MQFAKLSLNGSKNNSVSLNGLQEFQVFNSEEEALAVEGIFEPSRYCDYDTTIRVVAEDRLDDIFR